MRRTWLSRELQRIAFATPCFGEIPPRIARLLDEPPDRHPPRGAPASEPRTKAWGGGEHAHLQRMQHAISHVRQQ